MVGGRGRRPGGQHALTLRLAVTLAGPALVASDRLRRIPELARAAEEVGVDQLGVPDHVLLGGATDAYPYGPFPEALTSPYPEPLMVLAAVAAVTSRIELAPSTLIAPLRPAPLLAKACATLDLLSGGRLVLGAGAGWHETEFAASNVPFAGRGARLDDTMRACRVLWRDSPASFASPTVSFEGVHCEPQPARPDSIRIWVAGGSSARAAARLADYADGWMPPPSLTPSEVAEGVEAIRAARVAAGRDPEAVDVKYWLRVEDGNVEGSLERSVHALAAAGVTIVQVSVGSLVSGPDDVPPLLERLAAAFDPYR